MSCLACDGRIGNFRSSETSCQKPRPRLHGRPGQCRPALPVHERKPGLCSCYHRGARARRVKGWFLRGAAPVAVPPCRCRCVVAETGSNGACQFAPDLVGRNLTASRPDQLWVADINCVPTAVRFFYLAVISDAGSRKPSAGRWQTINGLSWGWTRWRRPWVSAGRRT